MNIRFKKLSDKAMTPEYATQHSAGVDLVATEISKTENYVQYKTGLAVEIPVGCVGLLFPRSSISNYDLTLSNCVGVIDSDYRGEIMLRFRQIRKDIISVDTNGNELERIYTAKVYGVGERCGQLVIVPYIKANFIESDELNETVRGDGGYGSSGK